MSKKNKVLKDHILKSKVLIANPEDSGDIWDEGEIKRAFNHIMFFNGYFNSGESSLIKELLKEFFSENHIPDRRKKIKNNGPAILSYYLGLCEKELKRERLRKEKNNRKKENKDKKNKGTGIEVD